MGIGLIPQIFSKASKRTGITTVTAHSLRYYFCTEWIRRGGSIAKLKEMSGHKRLESLEVYLHLVHDESVKEELERVNPARGIRREFRKGRPRTKVE
jgi:site-specific recombinase XerD